MGIVFRQSIKTSIVYFAGALLGAAYTYLMAHLFLPGDAGITRNLIIQAVVLQVFFTLGGPAVVLFYMPRMENEPRKQQALLTASFLAPLVTALLFSIPYFCLKHYVVSRYQLEDRVFIDKYYAWVPFFAIVWSFISLLEMQLLANMKTAVASFMKEILLRLGVIGFIGLYYLKAINLNTFVILTILGHTVPLAGMLVVAARTKNFGFAFSFHVFSVKEARAIISFAWYHLLGSVTIYLMGYLDALLIASLSFKGLADAQVYSVAIFFATFLTLPYRSMTNSSTPKINEAYHRNDMALVKSLFIRSTDNMLVGVLMMWLLIIPNMHNAEALLKESYKGVGYLVLILSIGKVTDILTGPNTELIGLSRYYKFLFRITFVLVAAILVFDRLFIPHYGLYAAAWVTTICTCCYNIFKMVFLYIRMKIHPFSTATLKILLAAAIAALPALLLPAVKNPFIDACYRSAVTLPVFVGLLYYIKASPDLNTYISSIRRNKRLY